MQDVVAVPILPCHAINDVLDFYIAIGFEVTARFERPSAYVCIAYGSIQLHFFTLKDYDPTQSYSTCLIVVPDAETLFDTFVAGMRQHYGKKMVKGIPRITPLRAKTAGQLGFNIIDPGGNWIRVVQTAASGEKVQATATSALSKALAAAEQLADSKGDLAAAVKTLDTALSRSADAPAPHRVRALFARARMAAAADSDTDALRFLDEARQIPLTDDDRAALARDFAQGADLEAQLTPPRML